MAPGVQGGHSFDPVTQLTHASIWHDTPSTLIDLHPAGAYESGVLAVAADRQGGTVRATAQSRFHATLWSGTAGSAVDLHPSGAVVSVVRGIDGDLQAGIVAPVVIGNYHAALWRGTAASFVDLNPTGPSSAYGSFVYGAAGGRQVGWADFQATPGTPQHAALWEGTAASARDLHPYPGLGDSLLYATNGEYQVGWSTVPGFSSDHAGLWQGTAASFIDLSQFLPAGYTYAHSEARSVSEVDGLLYIGLNVSGPLGGEAWLLIGQVPAPGVGGLLAGAALWAARRRRRG
jgi:hypothetical protein